MALDKAVTADVHAEQLVKVAGHHVDDLGFFFKEAAPGVWDRIRNWRGNRNAPQPTLDPQVLQQNGQFVPNPATSNAYKPAPNPYMGGRTATPRPEMSGAPAVAPNARMKETLRAQLGPKLVGTMNAIADAAKSIQPLMMQQKQLKQQVVFHFKNFERMVDVFRQQFPGDPLGQAVQNEYRTLSQQMDFTKVDPAFAANKIRESAQRIAQQFSYSANGTMHDVRRAFPGRVPASSPVPAAPVSIAPGAAPAVAAPAAPAAAPLARAASHQATDWFKLSQAVDGDFSDRNFLNDKIDDLKLITVTLQKVAKLAVHTQTGSRDVIRQVLATKKLSNYPGVEKKVVEAEKACLDSPARVSGLLEGVVQDLVSRVTQFEKDRDHLINKTMPNRWQGWRD